MRVAGEGGDELRGLYRVEGEDGGGDTKCDCYQCLNKCLVETIYRLRERLVNCSRRQHARLFKQQPNSTSCNSPPPQDPSVRSTVQREDIMRPTNCSANIFRVLDSDDTHD